jgi:hypothetical protein
MYTLPLANTPTDEQIITFAYDYFGDCCPLIEEREGELCLTLTHREKMRRYALPIARIRVLLSTGSVNIRGGEVKFDHIH